MSSTKAVFLDRDNTLIHNDGDLGDPNDVKLIKGAASAVASLRGLGYKIIVISNQGGVARGKYSEADVDAVNQRINELIQKTTGVTVDRFYYCPYHPEGSVEKYRREHPWRKPQPGMLTQAAQDLQINLAQSWTIGDQPRDVEAGLAAGTRSILLNADADTSPRDAKGHSDGPQGAQPQGRWKPGDPVFVVRNLVEAVRIVGQQLKPEARDESGGGASGSTRPSGADAPSSTAAEQSGRRRRARKRSASKDSPLAPAGDDRPRDDHAPSSPSASAPTASATSTAAAAATGAGAAVMDRRSEAPARPKPAEAPRPQPSPAPAAAPRTDADAQAEPVAKPTPRTTTATTKPMTTTKPAAAPSPQTATGDQRALREPTDADRDEQPDADASVTERLLRQLLREMRSQRAVQGEFSIAGVLAIVLQMVAAVCLTAGLLMGQNNGDVFLRWISVGILLELGVIATLMLRR